MQFERAAIAPSLSSGVADPVSFEPRRMPGGAVPSYVARRHASLAAAASLWRTLQATGSSTAYQNVDWVEGIVEHLAQPSQAEPVLIEVRDARSGMTVMLVPLALVRERGHTVITWLDLGVCDYAAPLLAPGLDLTPEQMVDAWQAIRSVLPRSDVIRISRIPAYVQGRRNPIALLPGCRRMEMQASGLAIDGDPDTLLDRVCRSSVRRDMAKLRRRLDRLGEVAFVQAGDGAAIDAIFDALVAQRRDRFAQMGRFDLLSRPDVEAFYRAGAHRGLAGGPARLFGLSLDGAWIAAAYGLVHGDAFHGILLTIADGPWQKTSPGMHIVAETLRWARGYGLDYFDFTVGAMPYKNDFGVQTRKLDELLEITSPRGAVVAAALRLGAAGLAALRQHPEWYARVQTARRWVRRRKAMRSNALPSPLSHTKARDAPPTGSGSTAGPRDEKPCVGAPCGT